MRKMMAMLLSGAMVLSLTACGTNSSSESSSETDAEGTATDDTDTDTNSDTEDSSSDSTSAELSDASDLEGQEYIEYTLNLANNADQEWSYSSSADAWVLSIVSAVAYPEIEDEQGVSVCVPGAYVTGIDTDGDGTANVDADSYTEAVNGSLVIDYEAEVISTNGQVYTAATAPVILNTGAAGYSSSTNTTAATTYASEGYINVACGNRGKQDTATDEDGNTYYTGDAPSCLVDQKNATRFVKYNILLGNLPGSVDYFVSTGGSGGGAHATMFAATSNNSDFYDYEIEAGAVGVYLLEDGTYSTTVTIDGVDYEISDGAWGCIAYSAITSLYEADMALAFEYYMDTTYEFNTSFQAQLAEYLSEAYMEYINEQNLTVEESAVGFDLNDDGDMEDTIALTIEYDLDAYPETNGYYGTYLDLYLAEFVSNLQWYLDNLDYSDGWTWFDEDGNALSDDEVAAMTTEEKATAFIEGRYTKGSTTAATGDLPSGMNGALDFSDDTGMGGGRGDMDGELPDGDMDFDGELPDGEMPDGDIDLDNLDVDEADADGVTSTSSTSGLPEITDGELPDNFDGELPDDFDGEMPDEEFDGEMPDGEIPDGDFDGEMPDGEIPDGDFDGELPDGDIDFDGEMPDEDMDFDGELPDGEIPDGTVDGDLSDIPDGDAMPISDTEDITDGELPDGELPDEDLDSEMMVDPDSDDNDRSFDNEDVAANSSGDTMDVGTPDAGTTQGIGSSVDSSNYSTYKEMVEAYAADIAEIAEGDEYGNNIVDLYNPLNYIGDEDTDNPTWVRILMGASEGDISMFCSLNLQIAMLNAGIDANIEWQWDGGHVPSEILSESFSLYVDQMYGEYANGNTIETPEATTQTENGTSTEATGTDLSSWVDYSDITSVSFSLADAVAYRTNGASKAMPGFDVIDYGQEDYVFGSSTQDARHWDTYLLEIFEEYADVLEPLFNSGS